MRHPGCEPWTVRYEEITGFDACLRTSKTLAELLYPSNPGLTPWATSSRPPGSRDPIGAATPLRVQIECLGLAGLANI